MATEAVRSRGLLFLVGVALAAGWVRPADAAPLQVFASVPPLAYLAEQIGGQRVAVRTLVGAGQNPHNFEPTPRLVAQLSEARVLLRVGWPFEERLLDKIRAVNRDLEIVDTRRGITPRPLVEDHAHHDSDEGTAASSGHPEELAGRPDPHFWLAPRNAAVAADTIAEVFVRLDAAGRENYLHNLGILRAELERVDRQIEETLAPYRGSQLLVYHPAYGYFADAYGLVQVAAEVGGSEPSARQLARLIEQARESGAKVVFVQPQFSPKSAETIARAIGGVVMPLDPLARDYVSNLQTMADKVRSALARQ